jgi:valyl-tRNA synthetase
LCPFITQQCWQELFSDSLIIDEAFPSEKFSNEAAVAQFSTVQNIVGAIRTIRAEKNLNPKDKVAASIKSDAEHVKSAVPLIMALGNLSELVVALNVKKGENVATIVAEGLEIFITVPFDADAETARIEKLKAELVQKIEGLKGRLSNSSYTDKAPEHLVAQTRDQLAQAQSELEKLS